MAEPEVATRAPESDAVEGNKPSGPESLIAGDTPAQSGASLGVRYQLWEFEAKLTFSRSIV